MMRNPQEKRKFMRLNALVDVVYSKSTTSIKEQLSLTKNISKGGICLIAYEELTESDILDLKIYLPEDKDPINATGRVVWVKEFTIGDASKGRRYDAGVEFIKVKDEALEKINKYMFSHT